MDIKSVSSVGGKKSLQPQVTQIKGLTVRLYIGKSYMLIQTHSVQLMADEMRQRRRKE